MLGVFKESNARKIVTYSIDLIKQLQQDGHDVGKFCSIIKKNYKLISYINGENYAFMLPLATEIFNYQEMCRFIITVLSRFS